MPRIKNLVPARKHDVENSMTEDRNAADGRFAKNKPNVRLPSLNVPVAGTDNRTDNFRKYVGSGA